MFRLFRAAFRSLSSIKVTVIGLTILTFLSSAIFTLLSDVRNAYNDKFVQYNSVSRLHDVTLDLDVNNEGTLPDGAFVKDDSNSRTQNGEEIYIERGTDGYQNTLLVQGYQPFNSFTTPIYDADNSIVVSEEFEDDGKNIKTNVFDTANLVRDFQLWKSSVKRDDYGNVLDPKDADSLFIWDLDTRTFTPRNSDQRFDRFRLVNGSQELMTDTWGISVGDTIELKAETFPSVFDPNKTLTLDSIIAVRWLGVRSGPFVWDTTTYYQHWGPRDSLWVNLETKEMITESHGRDLLKVWQSKGVAYQLPADINRSNNWLNHLMGMGGLDLPNGHQEGMKYWYDGWGMRMQAIGYGLYFDGHRENRVGHKNYGQATLTPGINPSSHLLATNDPRVTESSFNWSQFGGDGNQTYGYIPDETSNGADYWNQRNELFHTVPIVSSFKWPESLGNLRFSNQEERAIFKQGQTYHIPEDWIGSIKAEVLYTKHTFNITDTSKWTGSYYAWYQSLSKTEQEAMSSFYFWTKKTVKDGYPNDDGTLNGDFNSIILETDVNKTLYSVRFENNPDTGSDDAKPIGVSTNLSKIENLPDRLTNKQEFNVKFFDITNSNKESELLAMIRDGARIYTRNLLYNKTTEVVGDDNIGRRTTMTVSSFDTNTKKSQVFHFVNASKNVVWDEKTSSYVSNVGKMYYEELSPTMLLYLDSNKPMGGVEEDEFKFMDPPPTYAAAMIGAIFRGYHIPDEHFSVDVDFLDYNGSETKFVRLITNKNKNPYYITKIGEAYHILDKTLDSIKNSEGQIKEFSYEEMHSALVSGFTTFGHEDSLDGIKISGKVNSDNGWYIISEQTKNLIIPVEYRNLPSIAIEKALTENTYENWTNIIRQAMEGILSVGENPWVPNDVLTYLALGVEESLRENSFYNVMESGTITRNLLGKVVYDALYFADQKNSNQPILTRLFTGFLDHIIINLDKESDKNEQREIIKKELSTVFALMEEILHIKLPFDVLQYVDYASEPAEFMAGVKEMLQSVNTQMWLEGIKEWYDENYYNGNPIKTGTTSSGQSIYAYFGTRELLTPLFEAENGGKAAIDSIQLTNSVNKIVNSLDMTRIIDESIETLLLKIKTPAIRNNIRKIVNVISKDSQHSNIVEGVKKLISKLDATSMMTHIATAFNNNNFRFEIEVDGEIMIFESSYVRNNEMIGSILGGIFSTPADHDEIIEIISDMFNVSSKTDNIQLPPISPGFDAETNLVKPGRDENALDIYDLQELEGASYDIMETENTIFTNYFSNRSNAYYRNDVREIINKRFNLNLTNDQTNLISQYADKYNNILKNGFNLNNYNESHINALTLGHDENSNSASKNWNDSLADMALWTMKSSFRQVGQWPYYVDGSNRQALDAVIDVQKSSIYSAGTNAMVIYNFWLKSIHLLTTDLIKNQNFSYDQALSKAQSLLWNLAYAGMNSSVTQLGVNIDNGFTNATDGMLINIEVAGSTRASAVAIDPQKYKNSVLNDSEIKNSLNSLYEFSSSFRDYVTRKDDLEFIRQLGMLGWSKISNSFTGTTPGFETGRWQDTIYHLLHSGVIKRMAGDVETLNALIHSSDEFAFQTEVFKMVGLNPTVASTYYGVIFPGIAKSATISFNNDNGNLGFILKNGLADLSQKSFDDWLNDLDMFGVDDKILDWEVEMHGTIPIGMDMYYLKHLFDKMRESGHDTFFDLNLTDLLETTINASTEVVWEYNQIRFSNIGSYIAKVSDAYLKANNKEIYGDSVNHKPIDEIESITEMSELVETIDSAYTINVNNQKYLIIGKETAVDYMYPVLDEANMNVDTANQAIVFVNEFGFERVWKSNQNAVVKDYLIISADHYDGVVLDDNGDVVKQTKLPELPNGVVDDYYQDHYGYNIWKSNHFSSNNVLLKSHEYIFDKTHEDLRNSLNHIVDSKITGNTMQKAFLATEVDPTNPERSLRVTSVQTVIDSITKLQFYAVIMLIVLVGIVTVFIGIRYIDTRKSVIGILRAEGYSKLMISTSFIVYGVITSAIGGTIGYLVGHFMQIPLMNTFSTFWTVPTSPYTFSWISLLISVAVPITGISILIIVTGILSLKEKPINLISGAKEASTSQIKRILIRPFKKFSIITRFRTTLALGSFFKMTALSFTFALTSIVSMFALASMGIFNKVLDSTYGQRHYEFATDLFTPTLAGGAYDVVNKNSAEDIDQLYIPMGNNIESSVHYWDYFKPGPSRIMDLKRANDQITSTRDGKAHMMTKSSLDVHVNAAIAANPWDLAKTAMPDSQYVSALNITSSAAVEMMFNQFDSSWIIKIDGENVNAKNHYKNLYLEFVKEPEKDLTGALIDPFISSRASQYLIKKAEEVGLKNYYQYKPTSINDGSFVERVWSPASARFEEKIITTSEEVRERFRTFLMTSYENVDVNDYTMIYGGVNIDEKFDEQYSWAQINLSGKAHGAQEEKIKLTGINLKNVNSLVKPITESGTDLRIVLDEYLKNNISDGTLKNPYPIVPNEVVSRKWNISKGDIRTGDVFNTVDRYQSDKLIQNKNIYFKVIGINSTYINTEIITSQDVVNSLIGMNLLEWNSGTTPFNGVMSDNDVPQQAIESLLLYSQSGYWAAMDSISFPLKEEETFKIGTQMFGDVIDTTNNTKGALRSQIYLDENGDKIELNSYDKLNTWVNQVDSNMTYQDLLNSLNNGTNKLFVDEMILSYLNKYDNSIYSSAISSIAAENIETGFVYNITDTVSTLVNASVVITLIISVIILVVISTMIVNENKKKIATFAVMGYTEWEKARMFLLVYIPFILIGILVGIPIAYWFVALFNNVVLTTTNMALPLALTVWHVAVTTAITICIIIFTIGLAYLAIKQIKPIYILQGDD